LRRKKIKSELDFGERILCHFNEFIIEKKRRRKQILLLDKVTMDKLLASQRIGNSFGC